MTLRSDFNQIDDEDQWLGSGGFIYVLSDQIAVESWDSQDGAEIHSPIDPVPAPERRNPIIDDGRTCTVYPQVSVRFLPGSRSIFQTR